MKKLLSAAVLFAALAGQPAYAADTFEFDKAHTNILFFISHLGFDDMVGVFTQYDGSFTFDPAKPEASTIDVTIKPSGVRTSSSLLDEHLQGDKWFNTAKFPDIHFVSKSIKITGKDTGDVTGDVTLLGVTKPAVLHVKFNKAENNAMTNNFEAGFHAEATIKRSDFGMSNYVPMVGDDVKLLIEVEAIDTTRKEAEKIKH